MDGCSFESSFFVTNLLQRVHTIRRRHRCHLFSSFFLVLFPYTQYPLTTLLRISKLNSAVSVVVGCWCWTDGEKKKKNLTDHISLDYRCGKESLEKHNECLVLAKRLNFCWKKKKRFSSYLFFFFFWSFVVRCCWVVGHTPHSNRFP